MLNKRLIIAGVALQLIGVIWDGIYHVTDPKGFGEFLALAHWPIFIGFGVTLLAVLMLFRKPNA